MQWVQGMARQAEAATNEGILWVFLALVVALQVGLVASRLIARTARRVGGRRTA